LPHKYYYQKSDSNWRIDLHLLKTWGRFLRGAFLLSLSSNLCAKFFQHQLVNLSHSTIDRFLTIRNKILYCRKIGNYPMKLRPVTHK